MVTIQEKVK